MTRGAPGAIDFSVSAFISSIFSLAPGSVPEINDSRIHRWGMWANYSSANNAGFTCSKNGQVYFLYGNGIAPSGKSWNDLRSETIDPLFK